MFDLSTRPLDPIGSELPTIDLLADDLGAMFGGVTEEMVPAS
ncbi:hypothetical protein [Bradyrhizobium sp. F1.4.3]